MTKYFGLSLSLVILFSTQLHAAPPMVEKEIFGSGSSENKPILPPKADKSDQNTTADMKFKNEIVFTGVIITPKKKVALLKEKKDTGKGLVRKEGDAIHDMVLKTIASNHVIVTDAEGKEIRYNLFQSDRKRPDAPPPPPPVAASTTGPSAGSQNPAQAGKLPPGGVPTPSVNGPLPGPAGHGAVPPALDISPPGTPGQTTQAPQNNPFGEVFKKFKDDRIRGVVPNTPTAQNPFQDAMKKAMGQ